MNRPGGVCYDFQLFPFIIIDKNGCGYEVMLSIWTITQMLHNGLIVSAARR